MIEEVLQSVKQTEEKAAQLVAQAEAEAYSLRQATEQEVTTDWEQAKERAKEYRMERLEQARSEADVKVAAIRAQSQAASAALWEACEPKIDAVVGQLMERIINGDC